MISPTSSGPPATRFLGLAGALLLAGYLALGWIGSRAGIGSLDANGIIHVVNDRLQTGAIEISRPPGHPLSEYWVLPGFTRIFTATGAIHRLSPLAYGLYQLAGGLCCLTVFWFLLREFPISSARRLLATACLAFSPQFLITSSDGEEFLWGMACLFIAVLRVAKLSSGAIRPSWPGWCLAIVFAVAASGYRIEYGAVALLIVFATLLISNESWPRRLAFGALAFVLLLLLWAPVLIHQGVAQPYPNPLSLKTRLAIGLYKIAFHAFGLIPLIIAPVFLFQARKSFRLLPSFGKNILAYWALVSVAIFFLLFFLYPTKILVVLPGVAFLILLGAAHAGRSTWICFVVACLILPLAHLDCFRDRHWTDLKFQPSLWAQNLAEKPSARGPAVAAAGRLAATGRHVLVSDLWPWDLAWQNVHAAWPGRPESEDENPDSIQFYAVGPGIVAARSVLDQPSSLSVYFQNGYDIWIDQDLYREMYMRYDLDAPTPATARIGDFSCRIVLVK